MEKNKSIDGLRTRAEKNPESSIDGLKTRSALPVFGTAKHPTLTTVRKARLAPDEIEPAKNPVTKKQSAQKVTRPKLARTTDEDLLAAFSCALALLRPMGFLSTPSSVAWLGEPWDPEDLTMLLLFIS